ncbi:MULTISPECIES: ribbon-helix-helix domain-containing protein [unclassified Brachybacterium]|uniref:ribbon-helix-helix domain-containing protein n=1 Tax=unclassified Brachybacterium TaxID=2623841 RepID=UPI000C80E3E6|nr:MULTISPECIES: ribbon-helix-helix domain-containing protein [unclassified Brachybacterium]PMC74983.1 antitoxin [Brachybacterium sp. UMB0905]
MKISVSLSEQDVALLDEVIAREGLGSRSAGIQRALRLLQHPELEQDYAEAWDEWTGSGEADLWDQTSADGIDRAAR